MTAAKGMVVVVDGNKQPDTSYDLGASRYLPREVNAWTALPKPSAWEGIVFPAAASLNSTVFIMGGYSEDSGNVLSRVKAFDLHW